MYGRRPQEKFDIVENVNERFCHIFAPKQQNIHPWPIFDKKWILSFAADFTKYARINSETKSLLLVGPERTLWV